jgi:hypothetical protein
VDLPGLWMSLYLRHRLAPEKLRESGETSDAMKCAEPPICISEAILGRGVQEWQDEIVQGSFTGHSLGCASKRSKAALLDGYIRPVGAASPRKL